jgi:hypothetical protein
MKKSVPLFIVIGLILIAALIGGYYISQNKKNPDSNQTPSPRPGVEQQASDQNLNELNQNPATPSAEKLTDRAGTVKGKLCFPSEGLPKGKIEAKRVDDGVVFTQDFPGSQDGGKAEYSFALNPGKYNLRYAAGDQYGYHTTVCLTGTETTCSNTAPRTMLTANVEAKSTVENFDLCDFYYTPNNAPYF